MNLFNLHTHSTFCDGKEDPESYIKQAIELGFHTLGFSSHAPVPFENNFALKPENLDNYVNTIRSLKEKYKDAINIYLSMEIDYIPGSIENFSKLRKQCGLDYVIGGIHLVKKPDCDQLWFIDGPKQEIYDKGLEQIFKKDIRVAVKTYFNQLNQMISSQKPDIIAHLDKIKMHNSGRYFSEDESWYQHLVNETLENIVLSECIVEVNTRGSDAHKPVELNGYYKDALGILKGIGFGELQYYSENRFNTQKIR